MVGNGATGTAVVAKNNRGAKVGVGVGTLLFQFMVFVGILIFMF